MEPNTINKTDNFAQILDGIENANNVLVTVSANPSIDQLAACIGLTLALNKKGKHGTAVFSGEVPSTLEFLHPENTIEKNTDSLQDFIISLDKSKADKLRYKVEDDFVKIFITPYRSSVSEADLNFSQGDFNIDLIIAIGVHDKANLDGAIIAHGRILHDATVATVTTDYKSELGSINWLDNEASSLCEMVTDLVNSFGKELIDSQIATALLTGMVAETDRFGNEKARPHTMSLSGVLMAAGASPQLISTELKEPEPEPEFEEPSEEIPEVVEEEPPTAEEALPEIPVEEPETVVEEPATEEPSPEPEPEEEPETEPEVEQPKPNTGGEIKIDHDDDIHIDDNGKLRAVKELEEAQAELEKEQADAAQKVSDDLAAVQAEATAAAEAEAQNQEQPAVEGRGLILDPPSMGGQLTANSVPEEQQYSTAPVLGDAPQTPILGHDNAPAGEQTLSDLEQAVNSPHVNAEDVSNELPVEEQPLDDARDAVDQVLAASDTYRPEPINALNATPLNLEIEENDPNEDENSPESNGTPPPPPVPPPMPPSTFSV